LVLLNSPEQKKIFADRLESLIKGEPLLFSSISPELVALLEKFYTKYQEKALLDKASNVQQKEVVVEVQDDDFQIINLNSVETDNVKEIGAEWLCFQTLEQLGLGDLLLSLGWSEKAIKIALLHIISKAVYSASENKTADWLKDNSAGAELFGLESQKISRHHLYDSARNLYSVKNNIEQYLSHKTNELFDIQDKIILYDLTNTYFEGRKQTSELAQCGRSKEKRSDAKLITLALVTNANGFVKYSKIFKGNMADCKTLETVVKALTIATSELQQKPMVVLDAGIAIEENLIPLKKLGYDYLCVTRSKLKNYELVDPAKKIIALQDRLGNFDRSSICKTNNKNY